MKNASPILCEFLAKLFRMYLMHGHISSIIMASTIIPLINDKLGDIRSSNNYRSIALSSLILKIFGWIILLLHGAKLSTDELPTKDLNNHVHVVGYRNYWLFPKEWIVFVGVMDMTEAFDNVKQSVLFWKLIDIPPIYLRLLLNIYTKQRANVCWNGTLPDTFPIGNGVKQGGVLSPHFYCIYTDGLFTLLRKKKAGCWVEGKFVRILGYADDLLLLTPSLDGLQKMIKSRGEHNRSLNLSFSTNANLMKCKTKWKTSHSMERIYLDANKIGDKICGHNDDLMEKRATYINNGSQNQ